MSKKPFVILESTKNPMRKENCPKHVPLFCYFREYYLTIMKKKNQNISVNNFFLRE